ncbi:MAG TPA: family 43 glycosylhydrolase [Flavobacterium sp.]|nr:family 43 glycosylhydrolase [Flavobacterium sp.]
MTKIKSLFLLLSFFFCCNSTISAQEYPKAILRGDYPDPSIVRDGKDYYMTHSPFVYKPGFLIWHSQDLVNWEPIIRILPEFTGSAMAPDLVKYKGRFYLYYPANETNWVTYADNIMGPWSKPIDLKTPFIDPGHAVGEDGKRYLHTSAGHVVQLADDGLSTVGEVKTIYEGWDFPKSWVTEGKWLESPKVVKRGEYFYMTTAEGGTAGPATSHMVVSARSKSVFGPWENSPYNPIVHTYDESENWWSKGHGTIIDDVNGNWWIVYHAYENGFYTLGRQTLLEPIEWTKDGWFKAVENRKPLISDVKIAHGMKLSDNFNKEELGLQWSFWMDYNKTSFSLKNGMLSVRAKGTTPGEATVMLTTATDKTYETQVEVKTSKSCQAGLLLFYSEKAYAGVVSDGKIFTIYRSADKVEKVPNKIGNKFLVKILNQANGCTFSVSKDGKKWDVIATNVDVSMMHHNNYKKFFALRPAIISMGKGDASFDNFEYKNAVPTEKDMSAYLMVYHTDETHSIHMALSKDGYSFTSLNENKPIIDGKEIADQKGIRDPHIFRGPDGAFYLAMTDLHVFAKRDGLRDTEWERDSKIYAWGNNKALILMKSFDLINWTRANIRMDEISAQFKEIGCAWAPEITYDDQLGKLMIYFTMRYRNEPNKLYYAYVNNDFNKLESIPQLLFEYPNKKVSAIDADITKVGDTYHMFYVSHDGQAGIKHAASKSINSGYFYDPRWYDPEPKSCEAPNVWKRIGEDKWVLMYDIYGIDPHNFGFSETSDFEAFENLGHFNEGKMKATNFSPKHGAVIHLTADEANKLAKKWKLNLDF